MPVSPIVKHRLQHYPFNPANEEPGYTDEEYRSKFGEEEYKAMMTERIRQKKKYKLKLFPSEEDFLRDYPGRVEEIS